jgi:hypothetical protein
MQPNRLLDVDNVRHRHSDSRFNHDECLGVTGENESRKNYFGAIFAWLFVMIALIVVLALIGSGPAILKQIQSWTHKT